MFQFDKKLLDECIGKAVKWTKDLVRMNSENPPGHEIECAHFCSDVLRDLGFEATVDKFEPGRANVVGFFGNKEHTVMAFNGHLDVVPAVGDWKRPPFEAYTDSERIWGRGSADMKSGCAAIMAACAYCVKSGMDLALRASSYAHSMPLIAITTVITSIEKKKQRLCKPKKHKNLATQRLFFLEHIITTN